ncbi:MAG: SRPBCC family protein [Zetaproteobacteria bacterium]|nr:SRPBCC family protein [Zetaproteobacteria bacterium]
MADQLEQLQGTRLTQAADADAEIQVIHAPPGHPVGKVGLWGLQIRFVVAHPPHTTYTAMTNIERYPEFISKVKRATILRTTASGFVVDYEERLWIFSEQSTQQWTLSPSENSFVSQNVGEGDRTSWTQLQVLPTPQPNFSVIQATLYVDTSFIPEFVLNLALGKVAGEYPNHLRHMIATLAQEKHTRNAK